MNKDPNLDELIKKSISESPEMKEGLLFYKTEHGSRELKNFDPFYVKHGISESEVGAKDTSVDTNDTDLNGYFATFDDTDMDALEVVNESYSWMVISGSLVLCAVALAVFFYSYDFKQSDYKPTQNSKSGETQKEKRQTQALSLETRSKAESMFQKFATAKSADEIKGFIWNKSANAQLIDKLWAPIAISDTWIIDKNYEYTVDYIDSNYIIDMTKTLPNGQSLWICFRYDEQEQLVMDWRASLGYGSATFKELSNGVGDATEIRTFATPINYYTFAYPEEKYRSFKLYSPNRTETIYGYVKIGDELEMQLINIFLPDKVTLEKRNIYPVLLELVKSSSDSLPNQWEIKRLIGRSWIER